MLHTEIINNFIKTNNYKSYLEIGTFNRSHNFNKIVCENKKCVDPATSASADYMITSDDYFKLYHDVKFDIIFIDGLHHATQVYKDIINALNCLNEGGTILCHDILPVNENSQKVPRMQGEWTGDCWMAWVWLRATREDLRMAVIDTDYGIGVIKKGGKPYTPKSKLLEINENITYENFEKNKSEWLNLVCPLENDFK